MDICRACLQNNFHEKLIEFDETFVNGYNLLTNLNIALSDGKSQYICESCRTMVNSFITFREKCIASELVLQQHPSIQIKKEEIPTKEPQTEHRRSKRMKKLKDQSNLDSKCVQMYSKNLYDNVQEDEVILKTEIKIEEELCFEDDIYNGNYELENINQEEIKGRKTRKRGLQTKSAKLEERNNVLSCGLCKLTFSTTESAEHTNHLESHKSDLCCNLCKDTFESWPELLGHRLDHLRNEEKYCHVCKKAFRTSSGLEFHYKKLHLQMEKVDLRCKQCSKRYPTPRKLTKHYWLIHVKRCYTCDYCSKSVNSKPLLISHMRCHSDTKPFTCNLCGDSFKQSGGLSQHMIRKHSPDKKNCNTCNRVFLNEEKYSRHKCESGDLVCPVCGINVLGKKRLQRHMKTHNEVGNYKCSRCPAVYKSRCALKVHENRHDGVKRYKCEFCNDAFYSPSSLLKHRRRHTGERPYKCSVCHKGFTANHNLKVHMRVHGICNLIVKKTQQSTNATFCDV